MPYTIPDESEAAFPPQARLFQTDLEILALAHGASGVISGCAVTAQGSPNMTVAVAAGVAQSLASRLTVAGGNATITAADGTNPRLDVVVVTSGNALAVRAGTAAASPLLPPLTAGDVAVARVYVPASDTTIASNQIIDARVLLADYALRAGDNFTSHVSVGTNPAASGAFRLANAAWLAGRNAANNADVNLVRLGADNRISVGAASFEAVNPGLYMDRTNTVTQAVARTFEDDTAFIRLNYTGNVTTPQIIYQGSALNIWGIYNTGGAGNLHTISAHMLVNGASDSGSEVSTYYSDLSLDANIAGWGTDENVIGPESVQARFLVGNSVFIGNYNSGTPAMGHWGNVITTKPDGGGGQLSSSRVGDPTWSINAGLAIVGWAGTLDKSTLRKGFTKAIQIGGFAGGWMSSGTSYIGTGVDIRDYVDDGIYIHDRASGATGAALAIASGAGGLAIGATSTDAALAVTEPLTDPSIAGVLLTPSLTLSTNGKAIVSSQAFITPSAALSSVYGMLFIPTLYGTEGITTRTVGTIDGLVARVDTHAAYDSNITEIRNFTALGSSHAGGGTVANLYGYMAYINTGDARVTNAWQFYALGNAPSYFGGTVQLVGGIADATDIPLGTGTGTKIGTATTQKLGVWNATPIVRPSAYTQTYSTATKTNSNPTATALTAGSGTADGTVADVGAAFSQTTLNNNFKDLATAINALIVDVANNKQVINSIIDDQQAIGWFG